MLSKQVITLEESISRCVLHFFTSLHGWLLFFSFPSITDVSSGCCHRIKISEGPKYSVQCSKSCWIVNSINSVIGGCGSHEGCVACDLEDRSYEGTIYSCELQVAQGKIYLILLFVFILVYNRMHCFRLFHSLRQCAKGKCKLDKAGVSVGVAKVWVWLNMSTVCFVFVGIASSTSGIFQAVTAQEEGVHARKCAEYTPQYPVCRDRCSGQQIMIGFSFFLHSPGDSLCHLSYNVLAAMIFLACMGKHCWEPLATSLHIEYRRSGNTAIPYLGTLHPKTLHSCSLAVAMENKHSLYICIIRVADNIINHPTVMIK